MVLPPITSLGGPPITSLSAPPGNSLGACFPRNLSGCFPQNLPGYSPQNLPGYSLQNLPWCSPWKLPGCLLPPEPPLHLVFRCAADSPGPGLTGQSCSESPRGCLSSCLGTCCLSPPGRFLVFNMNRFSPVQGLGFSGAWGLFRLNSSTLFPGWHVVPTPRGPLCADCLCGDRCSAWQEDPAVALAAHRGASS